MFKRSVIAMACIFALSACGGGGGGSPDVKSADTLSKPAAPVVSEKETEAKEDAPQAGSQGQGAPSAQGSQDMAAVSEENTGNGGAATADNPKNEDEAQNDMPQNTAGTDSLTPNHTPASNMPAGNMENQAPDAGESEQPANQPDMANTADGMQGDDPSAGGENAGNTAAQGANQAENNQAAGSSDSTPASNPAHTNSGGNFGRVDLANGVLIDGPSQNITLTHCKDKVCSSELLDEEVLLKSEFEKLSNEEKIKQYKKDGRDKFTRACP